MLRTLVHYWRVNLAVAIGAAVAAAVLAGALLVGDSVRGSLRDLTLDRLGGIDSALVLDRFFRDEVASDLGAAAPAIVQLCAESYRRHGRRLPADTAGLLRLVDALHAEGQVRLFTATPHNADTPEGGLAVLHDGHTAHYWIAGSAPGPAMTVLLGHTLPRLRDDGIEEFDFVGANTPSIAEFKRHFGPVLTPYFYLEKITRPELRLLYRLKGR